uniref:ABC-2 type transporter transmembrane domain-containing protein n=1 Tax=Populus alba TaxID=43335 RepID=A0A4U5R1J4_POPAL|nr:hypothetical protein D5086_0000018920 [Populus alba]
MYSAVIFLGATNTSSVMSIVSIEITVFYRERAAGMYSELPRAFAQVAIEGIYVAIQTFVYSILLYVKIEFSWEIKNFLWFYFFIFTAFMYFTLYGMMLVALTPGHQIAATCCLASSSPEHKFLSGGGGTTGLLQSLGQSMANLLGGQPQKSNRGAGRQSNPSKCAS